MDTRLMQQIKDILKEFPQYWNGEELQRPIVIDDLKNYDALLISALLKNQKIRENYSIKAGDVVIFKVQEFIDILRYKDYWADSYTKYSNTIGLSSEGKYLQYNTDVVLDFPYKDCVLKGGMTKEDTGKEEVFYNEVIARDEIDTLLAPKTFVNVKKYDTDGEHTVDSFSNEDNLIIKGNNLLALHSLKERYAGKVKCIYIDPPYNTGKDSFSYNDYFNHSSWLTFVKNRIEIAYDLLSEDGSIFVHLDDNEVKYLGVLLDEIFGKNNFIELITVVNNPRGRDYGGIANMHEFIYVYRKSELTELNLVIDTNKEFPYTDEYGLFEIRELRNRNTAFHSGNRPNLFYPIYADPNSEDEYGFYQVSEEKDEQYSVEILPKMSQGIQTVWRWGKPKLAENKGMNVVARTMKDGGWSIQEKYRKNTVMARSVWWDKEVNSEKGTLHLKKLMGGKVFAFPKPEGTLKRIIEIGSNENDIVLDFFMGSATTQAVAMKMNRRFIGIEQMDYINTVSVPRLQKVIEGEQGGISKDVNWQGGGSFVYVELMELNQVYMNKIDQASTKEELAELWDELDKNADLNFQLDKEKLTNELLKEHDEEEGSITFNDLTFDEQKEIFKKALDKNQLYVPYSEIEDKNVIISDDDKAFNHSFYSNEGE